MKTFVFISGMSDFLAELDSSVRIQQEPVLGFCAIHNVTSIYTMHLIIAIFSIAYICLDHQHNNGSSSESECLPMSMV